MEYNIGQHGEGELSSGRSITVLERLVALDPKNREYRVRHASSLRTHGEILLFLGPGRFQEAEPILSRSRDLIAQLEREGPLDPIFRRVPSLCETALSQLYAASGRVQEAEKAYRRAITRLETLNETN
jgi:hypothetical protein